MDGEKCFDVFFLFLFQQNVYIHTFFFMYLNRLNLPISMWIQSLPTLVIPQVLNITYSKKKDFCLKVKKMLFYIMTEIYYIFI